MSFIIIEYTTGDTIIEIAVSSVRDAFITGSILDKSPSIFAWRIKDLKGGLKYNYGWAPESEWNKYKQVFFPESVTDINSKLSITIKPTSYVTKSDTSYDDHLR